MMRLPLVSPASGQRPRDVSKPLSPSPKTKDTAPSQCFRCGRVRTHVRCPAMGSQCNFCGKLNHWEAVCRPRTPLDKAHTVMHALRNMSAESWDSDRENEQTLRIHTLKDIAACRPCGTAQSTTDKKWTVVLNINNQSVEFRIDTGARCNTLTLHELRRRAPDVKLRHSKTILQSYTNHQLKPVGEVTLETACNGLQLLVDYEVVDLSQENIISGDTAEKLLLVKRINVAETEDIPEEFYDVPELTLATGVLPGTYSIKINHGAKGVVHAPRRQPEALRPRIVEKLHELEESGYITPVKEPTEWVSSLVVLLRNNKVRICIDPRDLNKVVRRDNCPMKTIEEVVSSTAGATVFSVLDAKQGFLQIPLDENSSFLTTFNTPISRYRWLHLPFGIRCTPEIFQKIMDQMLEGVVGATAIMDDILVASEDKAQHDAVLKQVLE